MRAHTGTYTGNLTRDAELRYTPNGHAVTNVDIALNKRSRDDQGNWVDAGTLYVSVRVWGRLAEPAADLRRGELITAVTSSMPELRAYATQSGEPRAQLTITADSISRVIKPTGTQRQ